MKKTNNKGITLIALVITIIVLLILAGISIAMLTGENGILTKAQSAKTETEYANAKEKVELAIMGARADDGQITVAELKTEVGYQGGTVTGDTFPVTVTMDGHEFTVDANGVISDKGNGGENTPATPTEATTHQAQQLTYSWTELGAMTDSIANSSEITSSTVEVEVNGKKIGVGDWLTISYGTGNTEKKVRILGFNHDNLADGSGKAGMSFEFVTSLGTRAMNSTNTNEEGWGGSAMRTALADDTNYFNNLPSDLQSKIKTVSKAWNKGKNDSAKNETATSDKLWLLSDTEVCGGQLSSCEPEGTRYAYYATNTNFADRIKYTTCTSGTDSTACCWWLRSPRCNDSNCFCFVGDNGGVFDYLSASSSDNVAPGFSI